mmetsp:Transcript_227/g.840  ORF Transcript_227/g.840 Transcript_227/m.840 type:complete len:200 (-) Transcript_227:650-1249(-)
MNISAGSGFLVPCPFMDPKLNGPPPVGFVGEATASCVLPAAKIAVPSLFEATHNNGTGVLFFSSSPNCLSAALFPPPSPGVHRTTPSLPTMASHPPPSSPLGTAQSPITTTGVCILRTHLCDMRTSVITTVLSDPALASKSPPGKKHVAAARAFGWFGIDATALAVLPPPSHPNSFTVPSLHPDASKFRFPLSLDKLNK